MNGDDLIEQLREGQKREPTEWPLTFEEHQQLDTEARCKFERYLGTCGPLWQCSQYLCYFDSYARTERMVFLMLHAQAPTRRLGIFLEEGNRCDGPWPWRSLLRELLRSICGNACQPSRCLGSMAFHQSFRSIGVARPAGSAVSRGQLTSKWQKGSRWEAMREPGPYAGQRANSKTIRVCMLRLAKGIRNCARLSASAPPGVDPAPRCRTP
jgi:hypothetical protein